MPHSGTHAQVRGATALCGADPYPDEDVMSDTVRCPECHRPARVLDRFTLQRASGPVRYLRLQCESPPSFLTTAEDLDDNPPGEQTVDRR